MPAAINTVLLGYNLKIAVWGWGGGGGWVNKNFVGVIFLGGGE